MLNRWGWRRKYPTQKGRASAGLSATKSLHAVRLGKNMRWGNLRNSGGALFVVRRAIKRAPNTDVLLSSRDMALGRPTNSHIELPARGCSSTTILKEERRPTSKSAGGFTTGCELTRAGGFVPGAQALVSGYTKHQRWGLHVGRVQSRTCGALRMIATRARVCPSCAF